MTQGGEDSLIDLPGGGDAEPDDDDDSMFEDDKDIDDSDIINEDDIIVNHLHMDQEMKGDDINLIGDINGLGRERQEILRNLNYEDDKEMMARKPVKESEFFKAQKAKIEEHEANRDDQHLLPKWDEFFRDDGTKPEKKVLPFKQIDLIFNHKNIWGNL